MKKQGKLFSLINDKEINLAPGYKVIPCSDVEVLLSSNDLKKQVKADGDVYRENVIKELEVLKERSQKEGFEEGLKAWSEHIVDLEKEIESVYDKLQKMVLPIAMKAAQKIVGEELQMHKDSVVNIINSALKSVAQHKKIVIYVNKDDFSIIESRKDIIKNNFENLESFSLQSRDDIEAGGCIIETERGIINAQLSTLWQKLEAAFQKVIQK